MAQQNTSTTFAGLTKQVYGKLERIPQDITIVQDLIKYEERRRTGKSYNFPVSTGLEHGFTYNGTGSSVATLATAIAGGTSAAELEGYEVIGRAQIAYKIMEAAAAEGPQAFEDATKLTLENLSMAASKRFELSLLYGQEGLGVVDSLPGSDVVVITAASWSAAAWADMEGAKYQAWTGVTATETQHGLTAGMTLVSVDFATRSLTFAASDTTTNTNVAAGDVIYFAGARTSTGFNEMAGLHKILSHVSGSLFGIDATTKSRWQSNVTSSVGALNFLKTLSGISKPANRGFKGYMHVLLPTKSYDVLNSDLATARSYDGSYSRGKGTNGFQALEFYGHAGTVGFQTHPYVRDGDMMAFPQGAGKRVGASDLKVMRNKRNGDPDDIWFHLEDKGAEECRYYYDQAVLFERPSHNHIWTGIEHS